MSIINYTLKINFTSEWLSATGIGDGYTADTMLNSDPNGIPVLSGRTIRGALRESAWRLTLVKDRKEDLTKALNYFFGVPSSSAQEEYAGVLTVGTGKLSDNLHQYLLSLEPTEREQYLKDFSILRIQTALDDNKTTKKGSLRTIQCGVSGLSFECPIQIETSQNKEYVDKYLAAVAAGVKSIGANRTRGLGQCKVSTISNDGKDLNLNKVCLPPVFEC